MAECIDCGTEVHKSVTRCRECYIEALHMGVIERLPHHKPLHHDTMPPFREMDAAFCLAMIRAVEEGKEHPPGMKVSTEPCTSRPVFVDRQHDIPIRSSCAWIADSAAGGD